MQIALTLARSMGVVGMAMEKGDLSLARRGLLRWTVEVGLILVANLRCYPPSRSPSNAEA